MLQSAAECLLARTTQPLPEMVLPEILSNLLGFRCDGSAADSGNLEPESQFEGDLIGIFRKYGQRTGAHSADTDDPYPDFFHIGALSHLRGPGRRCSRERVGAIGLRSWPAKAAHVRKLRRPPAIEPPSWSETKTAVPALCACPIYLPRSCRLPDRA